MLNNEEIDMEFEQPPVEEVQEPITAIHLDEDNKVMNFISVMSVDDMPNCIEWQDGITVGDTYDPDTKTFTKAPIQKIVPEMVTMRQARLALLSVGLLTNVDTVINSLPSPQKEAAQIEWQYSSAVERNKSLVQTLGPLLGLSEDQLDDLFIEAATL